jgi:FkbM family methyltransferase
MDVVDILGILVNKFNIMMINLHDAIKKYSMNITGVIHVGGHHGEEYYTYKSISSIDNIIFFEPDKDSFKKLTEKTSHDNKVICVNKALGPFSCEATLHRTPNQDGQSNSILEPFKHTHIYPGIVFTDKDTVKVEPLDKFQPNPKLNFLNMDVQGAELNVLLGASSTLKNIEYILTEVNTDELYKNCALIEDLDYFLGKYNFKRVKTVLDIDSQAWGDALYIKEK